MSASDHLARARALTEVQCARFALLDSTYGLGLPEPRPGEPVDQVLAAILHGPGSAHARACLAWLAATATYPLDSQAEHVASLLGHGRVDLALEAVAAAMLEVGEPVRGRTLVASAPVQIDVTSVSRETTVTGIPRTVLNLVRGAGPDGSPHVWSHGALAPVSLGTDGTFEFDPHIWAGEYAGRWPYPVLRRLFHQWRAQSGRSRLAAARYRAAEVLARPFLSALASGNGPRSTLLLHGTTVVVPEVCHGDVADRLLTWRRHVGGFTLTVLVHDLLPITQPQWFTRSHVGDFMAYVPVIVGADRVVTTTEHTGHEIGPLAALHRRPVPELAVASLPVTAGAWTPVAPDESILPRFTCVGTVEPRKNHDTVLRACTALAGERYPVHLTLVGGTGRMPASTRELIEKARHAGVVVDLATGVGDDRLRGLLDSSVASLFLSWAEGYGLPVLESLACGTPVVCSAVEPLVGFSDIGGIAFVDPADHLAVAAQMRDLITQPGRRDRLASEIDHSRIPVDLDGWAAQVVGVEHEPAAP